MPFQAAKLKGMALDFLFPRRCVGCGGEGDFICPSCRRSIARIVPPLCPLCGEPQPGGVLCSNCVGWRAEIDGIRALFQFHGVVRQAIHQLKYQNLRAIAGVLAQDLSDYLAESPVPGDVLVPVPLHGKRLRERGYNQSLLLAQGLGELTGLPVVADCLIRRRHALPQARTATIEERRANVSGAFACVDSSLKGSRVLLIDDVSTTGATLDACAAVLKSAGAASVWGLVLAKEI